MTIGRAIRLLLTLAAALFVLWAFIDVTVRTLRDDRQGRKVIVSVLYWGNPEEKEIVDRQVEEFEALHPDIKVQRIHTSAFDSKLKTMLAAGDPPDVFYLNPQNVTRLGKLDLIEPLDGYLERDPQVWFDDFYPQLLDTFRFNGTRTGDGLLYGLPKDFTTTAMYVNVDLFQRAGVEVPYDGWTWDEFEEASRKIAALGDRIYGVHFNTWPAVLRGMIWNVGGEYFGTDADGNIDFGNVTLDSPEARQTMELIRRMRLDDQTAFNATGIGREGGTEFLTGKVGMIGPVGRWMTPTYRTITDFTVDVVPLPHTPGVEPRNPAFATAWSISASSREKEAAWQLLKFLAGPEGQREIGEKGLAVPAMKSVAESSAFHKEGDVPANSMLFVRLVDSTWIAPDPEQPEWERIVTEESSAALQVGSKTVPQAAAAIKQRWADELESPLKTGEYPTVAWLPIVIAALAVVMCAAVVLILMARREKLGAIDAAQARSGYLFISPWLIGFFLLTLGPMVLSAILAFTRWTAMVPLGQAEFVGVANFSHLFRFDPTFGQSIKVTVYYVVLAVPILQVAALAVAILMNNAVRGIGVFRTIYFVPSVISGVALGTLWLALFNNDYGLINELLRIPLGWVGLDAPDWFGVDANGYAIPAFVIMSLWGVGSAMVIYLAGLKNIPQSLYEAGTIDGTGPWHRLWNITLPMLSPLIFFNVVMGIIGSFQVFTQAYVMTGAGPDNATLFYVLNLYYQAFEYHNMGYASAMAWVLFLILLALTLIVFRSSRKLVYYEGLKA